MNSKARKTSFGQPHAPKVSRKGSKNKRTLLKESVGVATWEQLQGWVTGNGISQCIAELEGLGGKDYVDCFLKVVEFVKPKLSRSEVTTEFEKLSDDDLDKIINKLKESQQ